MKKILIIYPHFPPSNLAGVHRPRLFAQHLPTFGWEPVILTVHEKYYEEAPDWNLVKLLPEKLRIEKVKAFGVTKPRIIGDIGLRAFFQLYAKAKQMLRKEKFDFLYIPIPSFYCALLGRWLHETTGIRYGIDYIDPWVHEFPGSNYIFSRHWLSKRLASILEPIAIKKVSLVTGVAKGYYQPVLDRNPYLIKKTVTAAMPYGAEQSDYDIVPSMGIEPYLFKKRNDQIQLVYAGAMLPKAYEPLEAIFESIAANQQIFSNVIFHFIGTGKTPGDPEGYNIRQLAEKYGLWERNVFEFPKRIPYLDVLIHLIEADGVFILGSTERHYTPSKIYQAVLSKRPILAVLHEESTAVPILKEICSDSIITFNEGGIEVLNNSFGTFFLGWLKIRKTFGLKNLSNKFFDTYSARELTKKLAGYLDATLFNKNK